VEKPKPKVVKHTVRPGETMQVLARKYKISVAQLRAANPGLGSGTRAGQTLNIPTK
jgi:N-acetylmuramoyl-L-alanine amidase